MKTGIEMAFAREGLPIEVFEAVATSPEEAASLAYKDHKARKIASIKARIGW